jgi:hypothetical protein
MLNLGQQDIILEEQPDEIIHTAASLLRSDIPQ